MDLERFVAGAPEVELHVHPEGALERDLLIRLGERDGLAVPLPESGFTDLRSLLVPRRPGMSARGRGGPLRAA